MNTRKILYALPAVAALISTSLPASAQYYNPYFSTPVYNNGYYGGDDFYYNRGPSTGRVVGKTLGGAAIGAGIGALGGLAVGALTGHRHHGYYGGGHRRIARDVGVGAAAGAALGGGIGLYKGLNDRREYGWY